MPESLIESELFGHTRGAFTGAGRERAGVFESANGGTLLLDEVGETTPTMQVKLLRAAEDGEIRRLGDDRPHRIDVRLIAATNRDLTRAVGEGLFRQDLYFRLKVVRLHVPPLRERPEDLRGLADMMLQRVSHGIGQHIEGYTPAALARILSYPWPGNIRELENAIESACAWATQSLIDIDDLPEEISDDTSVHQVMTSNALVRPLHDVQRDLILAAIEQNGGNKAAAADQLRIGKTTLFRKLKQFAAPAKATLDGHAPRVRRTG